jgi:hypothetical protein
MKTLHTILVSSIAFSGAAAEPLLEYPGLQDAKRSCEGGMTDA